MDNTTLEKNAVCGHIYVRCNYLKNTMFNVFNGRPFGNSNALAANAFVVILQVIPSTTCMLAFNKFTVKDM